MRIFCALRAWQTMHEGKINFSVPFFKFPHAFATHIFPAMFIQRVEDKNVHKEKHHKHKNTSKRIMNFQHRTMKAFMACTLLTESGMNGK
jgi:hypothetical protein